MTKKSPTRTSSQTRKAPARPTSDTSADTIAEIIAHAETVADIGLPQDLPPTPAPADVAAAWNLVKRREASVAKSEEEVERRQQRLERDRKAQDEKKTNLDDQSRRLAQDRVEHDKRVRDLDERERRIQEREQVAEAGFTERREQVEADLRAEEERRRKHASQAIAVERERWEAFWADSERALSEKHATLVQRLGELNDRERELAEATAAADAARKQAEQERRFIEELANRREESIERAVSQRTAEILIERDTAMRRAEHLDGQCQRLQAQVAENDRAHAALGGRTSSEILEHLNALREENADLRRRLDAVPHRDLQRLEALENEVVDLTKALEDQIQQNTSLNLIVQRESRSVAERESYAVTNAALQTLNRQLQANVNELVRRQEGLLANSKEAPQFPECARMDVEYDDQPALDDATPDLGQLAELMQQRMLHGEQSLSYGLGEIRLLLGGLSMSRLHLFQGISGIGKTGLACALAAAFGSSHAFALVPVQAGWRDPQDLVGYYNSFDRLFNESEFTKALYRAQCPQFSDRPYFIVLDEMNLSHPEQYFSNVLSALPRGLDARLELTTARIQNPPRHLLDGTHLAIPPNVWFIGTANHDETTVGFADKTYDRSFVLELPHKYPDVAAERPDLAYPLSFGALSDAFNLAFGAHRQAAEQIKVYFNTFWKDRLAEEFRIGWGNRLDEQIDRFAPVVVAAGGTIGEAADHLMATRILRMLRGRYDIHADMLRKLRDDVEAGWSELDSGHDPTSTVALLRQEMRVRGAA